VVYAFAVRPWQLRWGATDGEVATAMPGDEIVERPQLRATRAVTIAAPPAAVWPWLVQLGGYTRAGWYSYDRIDNGGNHSAEHIVADLQDLRVGDVLPTAPDGEGFTVERIDPGRWLVLAVRRPDVTTSVTFGLRPDGPDGCRLVCRLRVRVRATPGGLAYLAAMDPGDFVMIQATLRGIRRRAETRHQQERLIRDTAEVPSPVG
jgi:hypothetical protein